MELVQLNWLEGLASILQKPFAIICNVADNIWIHGLYICPDIDTIMYGLADLLDEKRGWGIKNDTFRFLSQLTRYGGDDWFKIGDMDLATHILRTKLLESGLSLTEITKMFCNRLSVKQLLLPASDAHFETRIVTDRGEKHLQEFWVRRGASDSVLGVHYAGIKQARPSPEIIEAIKNAKSIFIAPGNPVTSIGPTIAMSTVSRALEQTHAVITAVSPIIGNSPISGPAGRLMQAINVEVSPIGVVKLYSQFIDRIVIDTSNSGLRKSIQDLGIEPLVSNILMKSREDERALAHFLVNSG